MEIKQPVKVNVCFGFILCAKSDGSSLLFSNNEELMVPKQPEHVSEP